MPFGARAAIAIVFLAVAAAHAAPATETEPPYAGPSHMQMARLLVKAGRLEDARVFLEQARPAGEEEQVERLFLLGRIEMDLGLPRRAADRFEAILALRPGLTRVRLELAQAYYLSGRDDEAKRHFGHSLADGLPASTEAAVEGFLRRIDARKRWTASASASLVPETRRNDSEMVIIGGVPFRLDEDARTPSGTGGLITAGVSFSPTVAKDIRGVLAASGAAKVYERSEWNDTTVSGDVGLTRLFDTGSGSGGLRLGRRWTGGQSHHLSLGPWTQLRLRVSDSTRLDLAVSASYRKHDTLHRHDGWRLTAHPRLQHMIDGRTRVEAEPMFELAGAKTDHHRSRLAGVALTISRALRSDLTLSLASAAYIRRHSADDPLFGKTRIDRNLSASIRVLHRSLRYGGFAPYVGLTLERNRSSIQIHEYRNNGLIAGISRAF